MCCHNKKQGHSAWCCLWLLLPLAAACALYFFGKSKPCQKMMRKVKYAKKDLQNGIENAAEDLFGG